jgi:flagellar M-ring protein FliF
VNALLARLAALPARGKAAALAVFAVTCAAVAIAFVAGRDARVPLFVEPLRPDQLTEVVEQLAAWNVPFVPAPDNVRVDAARRNDVVLRLSLAGVPHAHVVSSSEALEKAGPLTPQAVLDAEQRAGLAGDLQLALRGIAGIEDARVILAPDRPATFADEAPRPASASVRLSLRPGSVPIHDVIPALRAFVAAAVPGLDPRRVAILDDRGAALGDDVAASDAGAQMETSLQSALDAAFGAGATIVRVRLARDARTKEIHDVRREPVGGRAIVASASDERYANDKKHFTRSHSEEDRGSTVHDERVAVPAGGTDRISVAVLVDAARKLDLNAIRDLASTAAGLVPQRGDAIAVRAVPFQHPARVAHATALAVLGYGAELAPAALTALVLLFALRWIGRPLAAAFGTRVTVRAAQTAVDGLPAADVLRRLSGEPPHVAAAVLGELPARTTAAVLDAYDPSVRADIVRRMMTATAPAVRALLRET